MRPSELSVPLTPESLPGLRDGLRAWLTDAGAGGDAREDIVLAGWEAAVNAFEHPVGSDGSVHVVAERREDHILVCVSDTGQWRDRHGDRHDRGLGLKLIGALMDRVEVVKTDHGTRILMCRCLSPRCG